MAGIVGVLADRKFSPESEVWLLSALALGMAYLLAAKVVGAARDAWLLPVIAALVFAEWRRLKCRSFFDNDVGNFAAMERRLAEIEGVVVSSIRVRRPEVGDMAPWRKEPTAAFTLRAQRLKDAGQWRAVSGLLRVFVSGEPTDVRGGDQAAIIGWLGRPSGAKNPGEFDYAARLLEGGTRAVLNCEDSRGVRRLESGSRLHPMRVMEEIRDAVEQRLNESLPIDLSPIAAALLLGKRGAIADDQYQPYYESGTLHLLVVSGMHVAIVYSLFWPMLVIFGASHRWNAMAMILLVCTFAMFTGAGSPVLRAAIVFVIALLAFAFDRFSDPLNSLGGAACALMAMDPNIVLHPGVQLSFAAVLAILLFAARLDPVDRWVRGPAAGEIFDASRWRHGSAMLNAVHALLASAIIWTILTPLLAHHFHLASPASAVLTPILTPLIAGAMLLGAAAGAAWTALGALAEPLIWALAGLLWVFRAIVSSVESVPGAFVYVAGFDAKWVAGFYALLFVPRLAKPRAPFDGKYLALVLAWMAVGLAIDVWPRRPNGMELHQLSVGHGLCTVLRFPGGETVLYDCGSIHGPGVAERTIAPFLWKQGIRSIDAVIVSHADVDHFSGLSALLRRFPMETAYLAPQMAKSREPAATEVLRELIQGSTPVRLIWRGDELRVGEATLRVLHPAPMDRYETDNAASLVIECDDGRQRWLLTGDLEGSGLRQMMASHGGGWDLFIAPHHGSRRSNDAETAQWARARAVVASDGFSRARANPLAEYAAKGARTYLTFEDGAVSFFGENGNLRVQRFVRDAAGVSDVDPPVVDPPLE